MAYLQEPLTIIDNQSHESPASNPITRTQFLPPAATWFDEDHQHFVALEARSASEAEYASAGGSIISGLVSLDSSLVKGTGGQRNRGGDDDDNDDEDDDNAISEVSL